jgi:hypothetical protein
MRSVFAPLVNQGSGLFDYDGISNDQRPIDGGIRNHQIERH